MTNNMEKVKQSIIYGSPYEAIISGFITINDILNYLLVSDLSIKNMIAYRAVCHFSVDQIVYNDNPNQNDKLFITLTDHQEYIAIYTLSLTLLVYGRYDEERFEVGKRIQSVLPRLITVNDFSRSIHLICDSEHMFIPLTADDMYTVVGVRSMKIITTHYNIINHDLNIWINNDYLVPLGDAQYDKYKDKLIMRCRVLSRVAPLYWLEVGSNLYRTIVEKNMNIDDLSRDEIKEYNELFPGIIPPEILNCTDFYYEMKKLSTVQQAYVLGYPIHKYVPSEEIIEQSIKMVEEIGIDNYCDRIIEQNKKSMSDHSVMINPLGLNQNITIANEQNVLTENVCDYNNFDVVRYYIDSHVYYFTRPEFTKIANSKKNVWTNSVVPLSVLSEIVNRIEIEILYKLPKSLTLKEMLEKVEKGNLIEKIPNVKIPVIPPIGQNDDYDEDNDDENYYENDDSTDEHSETILRVFLEDGVGIVRSRDRENGSMEQMENFLDERDIDYEIINGTVRDGILYDNDTGDIYHLSDGPTDNFHDNVPSNNRSNRLNNHIGFICPGCNIVHSDEDVQEFSEDEMNTEELMELDEIMFPDNVD